MIDKPKNTKITSGNHSFSIEWNPLFRSNWNAKFDAAQRVIDSEVLRLNAKYIPFQQGDLERSGMLGTVIGSGQIVYNSPYGRFQYYGKVMVGEKSKRPYAFAGERKVVTSKDLTYTGAPQRGALWFERMKEKHLDSIRKKAAEKFK